MCCVRRRSSNTPNEKKAPPKRRFGVQTVVLNNVGPVIGAHSGPGTVALFFLGRHR